jgi:hypothetical protein
MTRGDWRGQPGGRLVDVQDVVTVVNGSLTLVRRTTRRPIASVVAARNTIALARPKRPGEGLNGSRELP